MSSCSDYIGLCEHYRYFRLSSPASSRDKTQRSGSAAKSEEARARREESPTGKADWRFLSGADVAPKLEVTPGFEPGNQGFADPCLTTWLCHHLMSLLYAAFWKKSTLFLNAMPTLSCGHCIWSGQRGSNSLPPPWQGGALPDELRPQMVPPVGIEPTTRGFSVLCSTN